MLDIYSEMTDNDVDALFSTEKERRCGDRRKKDYNKALRKKGLSKNTITGHGMTICISTAKIRFTVLVRFAEERILGTVILKHLKKERKEIMKKSL